MLHEIIVVYLAINKRGWLPQRRIGTVHEDVWTFLAIYFFRTSFIKYQRDATYSVYLVYFYDSTCFGRSPRPSSGVIFLQTVVAATGVCHRYGVDEFHVRVIGSVCDLPWFSRCWWVSDVVLWVMVSRFSGHRQNHSPSLTDNIANPSTSTEPRKITHTANNPYVEFIHPVPMTHTSGCHYTF